MYIFPDYKVRQFFEVVVCDVTDQVEVVFYMYETIKRVGCRCSGISHEGPFEKELLTPKGQ